MPITAAQYAVVITADTKQAEHGMRTIGKEADGAKGFAGGFLSTLAGFTGAGLIVNAAGAAFNFLKGQVTDSVKAGMDANTIMAQTVAGLKSTHDASGMTAQGIDDLATHIMNMSGIQDDAVHTSENMLLTFTNIGKNVFPQATQAAADLATKMNGGLIPNASQMQAVSIQLGKALNDPLKGITALTRVGVTFDDQQKKQIATMMKHGDIAGAQGVILKELNKEFGGAADAAGQANGGFAIMTAKLDNLKQSLGQAIIPILTQLLSALSPIATLLMGQLSQAIAGIAPLFAQLQKSLGQLDIGELSAAFHSMGVAAEQVGDKIKVAALPILGQLETFVTAHLLPAVSQFAEFAAATLIPMFGDIATFVVSTVVPALIKLAEFFTDTVLPAAEQLIGWFRANVLPVLMQLVAVVMTNVLPVLEQLTATFIAKVLPAVERLIAFILPVLVPALHAIGWVISNVVGPALNFLLTAIGWLINKGLDLADNFKSLVTNSISNFGRFFNLLGTGLHNLGTTFTNAGHDLIQGLINGISNMVGPALKAMSNLGSSMLSTVKGIFGVHSPSTVFAEIGGNLSQGLINGVKSVDVAGAVGAHLSALAPQLSASLGVNASVTSSGAGGNLAGLAGAGLAQSIAAQTAGALGAGAASGAGAGQPIYLVINDAGMRILARGLLPYQTREIHHATGIRVQ